jgi:hypothetical protein
MSEVQHLPPSKVRRCKAPLPSVIDNSSAEERVPLASLARQKYSVRAMGQVPGGSPSTISRELRRNAQPSGYTDLSLLVVPIGSG